MDMRIVCIIDLLTDNRHDLMLTLCPSLRRLKIFEETTPQRITVRKIISANEQHAVNPVVCLQV